MVHVVPDKKIDRPLAPRAGVHELMAFHHAARDREQKSESKIGGGFREHVRCVGHQNSFARGRRDVDIIESYRYVGYDLHAVE